MTQDWTQEPWFVDQERTDTGSQVTVVRNAGYDYAVGEYGISQDDARRIVDCVNALAGIPDPAALVASHRQLVEVLEGLLRDCWDDQHSHMTRDVFERRYKDEFSALATARAVMGEV